MLPVVNDIIRLMETIAPRQLAQEWDNSGLQIGHEDWPVERILVALDPTLPVVQAACDRKINLLITHHPLIFQPLKCIDFKSPVGKILALATRHHLAIFSAHTNLDIVSGGLNDIFSRKIGLTNLRLLSPAEPISCPHLHEGMSSGIDPVHPKEIKNGFGRIGQLDQPVNFAELVKHIKSKFNLQYVKVSGCSDIIVKQIAVCTGSGSSLMKYFLKSEAQVFISGDLRYHDARDAEVRQRGLIDIGHFASEQLMVEYISHKLEMLFQEKLFNIIVEPYLDEKDVFEYI